jgi:ComF family protein
MQDKAQQALDIVFPPQCVGCQQSGTLLCAACFAQMQPTTLLPRRHEWQALFELVAVNSYYGPLRTCIHALKYEGMTKLAEPLGMLLAQTYLRYNLEADMCISVPLHSERYKQRGYNHAHLLAQVCATTLEIPLREDILVRSRATTAQVGLSAYERHQNVAGAFSYVSTTESIYNRNIIIIDDVCTTGATLDECAATLLRAGAASVGGLVLASSAM